MKAKSYCIAFGCLNNNKDRNLTFFSLPKDIERRKKWLKLIDREDLLKKEVLKRRTHVVCSAHFEDSSIKIIKHLQENAFPLKLLHSQRHKGSSCPEAQSTSAPDKDKINVRASTSKIASRPYVPGTFEDDDSDDAASPGDHNDDRSKDSNCSKTSRKDSETRTVTYQSGDVHEGFTCNACSGSIVGFRYTCVQCANFDLCGSCEARGQHSLHYVLRIPRPAPHAEVASVLSKIRTHLLYGLDTEQAQETDDRVVPALPEEHIKVEIKTELPDPLEHEDAFQPDEQYTEPEYTRESTSKEQRVAQVPIIENPAKVTETEPKTTEKNRNIVIEPARFGSRFTIYIEPTQEKESVPTKRKSERTTEPEYGSEKHMKMYLEEQSRAIETMMGISGDTAGPSTEVTSELLQEIKTEEKDDDEGSFEVFSHSSKKILEDAKPGPGTEKNMAATTSKKK